MEGTTIDSRYPDLDHHHHDQVVVGAGVSNGAAATTTNMKGRKMSWAKLRRVDSLNLEAAALDFTPSHNSKVISMQLINKEYICIYVFVYV